MSTKTMARLIAMMPVVVIGFLGTRSHKTKAAKSQLTIGQAACASYFPSARGDFKTGSPATGAVFQDAGGNLRFVNSFIV